MMPLLVIVRMKVILMAGTGFTSSAGGIVSRRAAAALLLVLLDEDGAADRSPLLVPCIRIPEICRRC